MALPSISIILTTYNWPQALARVLHSLIAQRYSEPLEIIVADDGSTQTTLDVIQEWQALSRFPIHHCWQEDDGFKAAQIRNKAVAQAKHEYLLFIDGDCVVAPDFVARHARLAQAGCFVAGNRVLMNQAYTQRVLNEELPIHEYCASQWLRLKLQGHINRLTPTLALPLGPLRHLAKRRWQGAKTCNLAVWRKDFLAINGFDENFTGWGFEDSDLVIRLQRSGIGRKWGQFAAPVFHLWHQTQPRERVDANAKLLQQTQQAIGFVATKGVNQYMGTEHDQISARQ